MPELEPISEQILLNAIEIVKAIKRPTYSMTADVCRYDPSGKTTPRPNADMLIEVEGNTPEEMPEIAPLTRDGYQMTINFVLTPRSSSASAVDIDTLLHRAFACLRKAIGIGYQFGGLAINSKVEKPKEILRGQIPSTIVPLTVWFITDRDDPFHLTN